MTLGPDDQRINQAATILNEFLTFMGVPVEFIYARYYVQTADKVSFTQKNRNPSLQPYYHVNFDAEGHFVAIIYSIPPKLRLGGDGYVIFFARQSSDGKRIFCTADDWLREVVPLPFAEALALMRDRYRMLYFNV